MKNRPKQNTDNAALPVCKPSKMRKRKRADAAFSLEAATRAKRRKFAKPKQDPLKMRTTSIATVVRGEDSEPLKMGITVNPAAIDGISPERIKRHLEFKLTPHRPIATLIGKENTTPGGTKTLGSPTSALTPGGTKLHRRSQFGLFAIYTNEPVDEEPSQRKLDFAVADEVQVTQDQSRVSDTFFASDEYKNIKKVLGDISKKEMEIQLTQSLLKQTKREQKANNFQRTKSQSAVMVEPGVNAKKGSADKYAAASHEYTLLQRKKVKCEWLHLIAYEFLGSRSQDDKNLVVASMHTNTEMMFAEAQARELAAKYPKGIILSVTVELFERKQLAKIIYYTITTPDFTLNFTFKPDTTMKPHYATAKYVEQIVSACLAASAEKKSASKPLAEKPRIR